MELFECSTNIDSLQLWREGFAKLSNIKHVYQINMLFLWNKIRVNSPLDWFWSISNLQMLFNVQQHASWLCSVIGPLLHVCLESHQYTWLDLTKLTTASTSICSSPSSYELGEFESSHHIISHTSSYVIFIELFGGFCHFERLWVNVMDVIAQYWMYFVG